jgi:hypothetical protein
VKLRIFYHSKDILVDLQMIRQQRHSTDGKDVTVSILGAISEFGVMDISPTKPLDVPSGRGRRIGRQDCVIFEKESLISC